MPPKTPSATTGAEPNENPEAAVAAEKPPAETLRPEAPKGGAKAPKPKDHVRLVCSRPNAGTRISGIPFATVRLGDDALHISARLTPEQAASLLRISGFAEWEGDEDEHARAIEDALRQVAAEAVGTPEAHAATETRELEELRAANRKLASDLTVARRLNEQQAEKIRQLGDEIQRLNERGVRAA